MSTLHLPTNETSTSHSIRSTSDFWASSDNKFSPPGDKYDVEDKIIYLLAKKFQAISYFREIYL